MKIAILGFDEEGKSASKYFLSQGADVTIHDASTDLSVPDGASKVLGVEYLKGLDAYDQVVRSPSVKASAFTTKAPVTTSTAIFFEKCPARIIGVTGTKGKGTTAALIARILGEAGWRTWLGGDAGRPPLDMLSQVRASHLVVLELSSDQLVDLGVSPHIAVCLMVAPEQTRNMREYVAAKGNIFWHQRPEDLAIYNAKNEFSSQVAQLSPGERVPYLAAPGARIVSQRVVIGDADICGTDEIGLIGPHNLENVCAAITATWDLIRQDSKPVKRAVTAFRGLEHRLQLVGEVHGVRYFDDSLSTTPVATVAAINSFTEPKVIILGGSEKNHDYSMLGAEVKKSNVRQVILIGDMAPKIRSAMEGAGYTNLVMGPRTMSEVVATARGITQQGDVVLLSPACASYGLFDNYKDRGNQFQAAVKELG